MEKKNRLPELQITELYLVKAGSDWTRTFIATIKRETHDDGNPIVGGKVCVGEGLIWGIGRTEEELGRCLDEMCLLKLDYGLHEATGIYVKIAESDFFLN